MRVAELVVGPLTIRARHLRDRASPLVARERPPRCGDRPAAGDARWIDDVDLGVSDVVVTSEPHPFGTRRGWVAAAALQSGDAVFTSRGGWARVGGGTWIARDQLVWNLTVEGAATYFVGEAGAWVHNNPSCAVDPSTIRFTQSSIGREFRAGGTLGHAIEQLRSGALAAEAFPPIRTFVRDGVIYTLDNRRLFVFQRAGVAIRTVRATAEEIARESWKFTTRNGGTSIRVRGGL